ncbi:hypothetical protein L21SP5_00208 [Salinivirga cyanobacteriivorans]|uniref:Uncharacterized protein n=1 Tax=Salinivirga cyanobacteriivorans TaxID=1307839 RepID=A0A0S2HV12_9BACT|nr:hypothetical protein [Salinivirga cyanobacteriivorans]ALO13888.1 hypothetical protein L21SP5_00208 [Salinivirga cyanobacteriivorans]
MEEGESIDLNNVKTEIASEGIDINQNLTCISPAGELFTLPENATRACFTTDFSNNIPIGTLTGYYIGSQFYTAVYKFSESAFLGYVKKIGVGPKDLEIEDNQIVPQLDNRSQDGVEYVYYGIPSDCQVTLKRIQISDLNVTIPTDSHDASGELGVTNDLVSLTGTEVGVFSDPDACILPDLDLTVVELQEHTKQVICNPYGQGGFLMMLRINDNLEYIYQNADMEAQDYYYRWTGDVWEEWDPSEPELLSQLDIFKAIFGIWMYLLVENPHEFIDAAGMIPIFGEPADIINGIWYLIEGNHVEASISFGSAMLPVIGDFAGKSIKYIRKVGNTTQLVSLSEETTASVLKVAERLNGLENPKFQARLEKLVDDLDQESAFTPLWNKLSDQANGDEIAAILDNINELPHSERVLLQSNLAANTNTGAIILRKTSSLAPEQIADFATDLKSTNLAEAFFENPNLVNAWGDIYTAGKLSLKTNLPSLNLFSKLENHPALKSKILNELDDVKLIEFSDDFVDANDQVFTQIHGENLLEVWKNDIRTNNIEELISFAGKGNLRNEYINAVHAIADRVEELRSMGKTDIEIAQEAFNLRRQTTIDFKNATPEDLLDIIFEFNNIRYTQTGLGDQWGLSWNGALTKATENGVVNYTRIIEKASEPLGDKQTLGKALYDIVGNETLPILNKYRMTELIP